MSGIDKTDTTKTPMTESAETYFANLPTQQCAYAWWDRIEGYYNEMRRTGRMALYRNSFMNFYMGWIYRASMFKSGEQGELTRSFVNHHRNLLLHLKVQTTQNKIAYKAQVRNSSSRSKQLIEFANGLAERYGTSEEYGLDTKGKQATEDCLVFAESSIVGLWNRFKGDPVVQDPATGFVYRDGDMEYFNVTPLDQIINTAHQDRTLLQWRVIRRWVNKYDWAAMYPKFHDQVVNLNDTESSYGTKLVTLLRHDNETIPVFYCFHAKTPAVPMGRLMIMADPTTVFEDGPLDQGEGKKGYDHIPVYDMVVTTMAGSPFGYTVGFDLIPQQQLYNEVFSAVATNNINFATQCVMAPKGSNIHYQNLATGMTFLEYDPKMGPQMAKPEALNLLHSQPESYTLLDKIKTNMELIAGVASMQRGQPDENITSGQYAALVTTQSVIFNSDLQKAYVRLMKEVMTGTVKTIKKNMIGKKVARIVGTTSEPYLKEFVSADLQDIDSIDIDLINPMLQTPAGKMNMADNLMKSGLIKDPQQYIGVYTDGDLPQLYYRQEAQLKLVKQENEAIMKGAQFECAVTDNHVMHILEHTPIIDTIEARLNPNEPYVVAALFHIQSHLNKLAGGPKLRPTPQDQAMAAQTGGASMMEGPINPILAGIIGDPTLPPGTPSMIQLPPMMPGGQAPQPGGGKTPPTPAKSGAPAGEPGAKQPNGPPGTAAAPTTNPPATGMAGPQAGAQG